MSDTIVPVVAILLVFGAPAAVWIVHRVFAHQERMAMIHRGIVPPVPPPDPRAFRKTMKYGAWPPGPPAAGGYPPYYDPSFYAQAQLRRGIQVAFIGFALLIGLSFIGYHGGVYRYGPWLLGGLIPMFVGIAQIIGAVLSGARIGVPIAPPPTVGYQAQDARDPAAAGTAAGVPPPGPYAGWRPGPTPEIEKPPSPPDYRG
jgi:hypothetical protein